MYCTKALKKSRSFHRRAIATVECAICLPIIVLITVATIDLSSALFLKESLTVAAYEGARVGALNGGTNDEAIQRVQEVLTERGITYDDTSVVVSSPGFDTAATLEHVTITVTVRCQGNMPLTGQFFQGRSLTAAVTFRKEFKNS
ncbi:MAG: pilus assembly protein [Planctomycetales bacterium]|nr:pilus assembly protein [Planctomycetales bacterium]